LQVLDYFLVLQVVADVFVCYVLIIKNIWQYSYEKSEAINIYSVHKAQCYELYFSFKRH